MPAHVLMLIYSALRGLKHPDINAITMRGGNEIILTLEDDMGEKTVYVIDENGIREQ